jgi:hypothetical protein
LRQHALEAWRKSEADLERRRAEKLEAAARAAAIDFGGVGGGVERVVIRPVADVVRDHKQAMLELQAELGAAWAFCDDPERRAAIEDEFRRTFGREIAK